MCVKPTPSRRAAIPLYLMAKAPIAGLVKTRMQPEISPAQSACLARLMFAQTVITACRNWHGEVVLCVTPNPDHPMFVQTAAEHQLNIITQINTDLGTRMMHALAHGIARAGCAAVMGCDVPHCAGEIFSDAHAMLARGENPLGRSQDGGFYLIGLQHTNESLFSGIQWGTQDAWSAVSMRGRRAGVYFSALPTLRDIDHYADLQWLASVDAAYQPFLKHAVE